MGRRAGAVLLLAAALGLPRVEALTLAQDGRARVQLVLAADAGAAEQTAAAELARYLTEISGAPFAVRSEAGADELGPSIQIGATAAARRAGLDSAGWGPEEWRILSRGGTLLLVGGSPRGTLYAVYRLLEDELGVRWWTPWEASVPRRPGRLAIGPLDRRGSPAFATRDVWGIDGPREFCARNRLNGDSSRLDARYGGREAYGPPGMCHTFFQYVPPARHFAAHPDYFSEIDGARRGAGGQLCLTQPALLDLVAGELDAFVAGAAAAAASRDEPSPRRFDFSPEDGGLPCACAACSALARETGSDGASLFAFLAALGERVRTRHPAVVLDTLAYQYTFWPPRGPALPANVAVRVSALQRRDFTRPVADPVHWEYQQALLGWRAKTAHLGVWDYTVAFGPAGDLPLPNLPVLAADLRYYRAQGVESVFLQHDHPVTGDLRDLKLWVLVKLLEDPARPLASLVHAFTEGYYGPAGGTVRRYLASLTRAAARRPGFIGYPARAENYRWLDPRFLARGQRLFEQAERSVAGDPVLVRRVRQARISLDRATLLAVQRDGAQVAGGVARAAVIRARLRRIAEELIELRLAPGDRPGARAELARDLARLDG